MRGRKGGRAREFKCMRTSSAAEPFFNMPPDSPLATASASCGSRVKAPTTAEGSKRAPNRESSRAPLSPWRRASCSGSPGRESTSEAPPPGRRKSALTLSGFLETFDASADFSSSEADTHL